MTAEFNALGLARSFLFVPANRPDRFAKALAGLDAVDALAAAPQVAQRALAQGRAAGT